MTQIVTNNDGARLSQTDSIHKSSLCNWMTISGSVEIEYESGQLVWVANLSYISVELLYYLNDPTKEVPRSVIYCWVPTCCSPNLKCSDQFIEQN